MNFYAVQDGDRIFEFDIPLDNGPVHLPDLAKLGLSAFQANRPDISLRDNEILFGFEHGASVLQK